VSFGTALGGVANAEIQHKAFVKGGPKSVHQTLALQVFGGSAHSNAAIEFGLRGVGTTNSNGCASGNVAIGEAMRYVRDGWADVMVAGAAEAPLSPLVFGSFAFIRTMSRNSEPSLACGPFDKW
jgi:3-oxoacyl-[acyl-carrier-protein] synthase II